MGETLLGSGIYLVETSPEPEPEPDVVEEAPDGRPIRKDYRGHSGIFHPTYDGRHLDIGEEVILHTPFLEGRHATVTEVECGNYVFRYQVALADGDERPFWVRTNELEPVNNP